MSGAADSRPGDAGRVRTVDRAAPRHRRRGGVALAAVVAVAVAVLAGCSGDVPGPAGPPTDAAGTIAALGAVPIPTGSPDPPPSSASPGRPALLAIGGPVAATLPGGGTATVTALGPDITPDPLAPGDPGPSQKGVAVLELRGIARDRPLTLAAADLSGRDEQGDALALAPVGAATATAAPGGPPAVLRVSTRVESGAAQMTWSPGGHPLALWTFNAELD